MTTIDRLGIALVVLAVGALVGRLLRQRLRPAPPSDDRPSGLREGLVVVTAPYCTRCTSLQHRLTSSGIEFATLDAAAQPNLLADLAVTTAPTLLRIDGSGRVADREHRDFSHSRLATIAQPGPRKFE